MSLFLFPIKSIGQKTILTDTLFQNNVIKNPITADSIANFTETSLIFKNIKFGKNRIQTAENSNSFEFVSKGFKQINQWKVAGKVSIFSEKENNVPYTLGVERTKNTPYLKPYYFYAPKAGDWKNNHVFFTGKFARNIYKSWFLQGEISAKWSNSSRNIDPRPKFKSNDYFTELMLGYDFKPIKLALFSSFGNKSSDMDYYFENSGNNQSSSFETYALFNEGLGQNQIYRHNTQSNVFDENSWSTGIFLASNKPKTKWNASYGFSTNTQHIFDGKYTVEKNKRFYLSLFKHNLNAYLQIIKPNTIWSISTYHTYKQSINFNVINNYSSFLDKVYRGNINLYRSKFSKNKKNYDLGQAVSLSSFSANDSSVKIAKEYINFQYISSFTKYFSHLKNEVSINATAGIDLPFKNELVYTPYSNDKENNLVKQVLMPDYELDNIAKVLVSIKPSYIFMIKNKPIELYASYQQFFLLKDKIIRNSHRNREHNHFIEVGVKLKY